MSDLEATAMRSTIQYNHTSSAHKVDERVLCNIAYANAIISKCAKSDGKLDLVAYYRNRKTQQFLQKKKTINTFTLFRAGFEKFGAFSAPIRSRKPRVVATNGKRRLIFR